VPDATGVTLTRVGSANALATAASSMTTPRRRSAINASRASRTRSRLASRTISDRTCSNELREAWLDVVLAWLYDHRAELEDPLEMVEAVYADFGYPAQIASFVRCMPMQGPDLGSPAANEQRLFERWKRYLDRRP
jgi:hypothetical protein